MASAFPLLLEADDPFLHFIPRTHFGRKSSECPEAVDDSDSEEKNGFIRNGYNNGSVSGQFIAIMVVHNKTTFFSQICQR